MILNLSDDVVTRRIGASGGAFDSTAVLVSASASELTDSVMVTGTSDASTSDGVLTVSLPPWSVNALEIGA